MEKRLGKKLSRRTFLKGATAGIALLGPGIPFITRRTLAAEPLYVGVLSPVSGFVADHGMMERYGMQMAVDEFKGKGVLGREVKLIMEDDESDPQAAARKARRLIEVNNVKYLCGGISSAVATSVGEVAQRYGALFMITNANSDTLTGVKAHRCTFRVCNDMAMIVRTVGPYLIEKVGKRWYFFTADYEFGWSGTAWGRKVLEKYGGTEVGEVKVPLNTRDFSAFLLKVRAAKPDVVVITVGGLDKCALIEQIYEFGIQKEMTVCSTLLDYEDAWAGGPEKNFGFHGTEFYHGIDLPSVKEFSTRYRKRWPTATIPVPTINTFDGYMGMRELLRAIERAGKDDVTAVIKALEGHTVTDSIKHDPLYIREWDHQFVWAAYVIRSKKPSEMKDRTDYFEVVKWTPGKDVARSKEENPVKLEPYPG